MTEEQINREYIKRRLKNCTTENAKIEIIRKMMSEQYINGLRQGQLETNLNEIRRLINGWIAEEEDWAGGDHEINIENGKDILQIIDKALGGNNE